MIKNLDLNFSLSRDLTEALCLWQVKPNFFIIALVWPLHFLLREKHCFVEVILARKKPINWFRRVEVQGTSAETKRSLPRNFEACKALFNFLNLKTGLENLDL